MKKLALTCMAVGFAGLSATAMAGPNSTPPSMPDITKGNQGCYLLVVEPYRFANPGKAFQAIRRNGDTSNGGAAAGSNPQQWIEYLEETWPDIVDVNNVGDFIDQRCGD